MSCGLYDLKAGCKDLAGFAGLVEPLMYSPAFLGVLEELEVNWSINFEHLPDGDYAIDPDDASVWIDTTGMVPEVMEDSIYFSNTFRANIIRAVRDMWHFEHCGDRLPELEIGSAIKHERIKTADIETFFILCAWEIAQESEHSALWRHALGGDCGDMAIVFSRVLEKTQMGHNHMDLSMQEGFKQWYKDVQRVDTCDHYTLEEFDAMLMDEEQDAPHNVKLRASEICKMTQRGCGHGSYLGDLNIRLLRDPAYSDIHDPINEAHLMHIMHDQEAVTVGGIAFRSQELAQKIFPALQAEDELIEI